MSCRSAEAEGRRSRRVRCARFRLGFPKLMVSTVASGNVAPYVGVKDIVMFPSIVDVAGLNRFSRGAFRRAAARHLRHGRGRRLAEDEGDKPLIVASMFGNTTACVEHARNGAREPTDTRCSSSTRPGRAGARWNR